MQVTKELGSIHLEPDGSAAVRQTQAFGETVTSGRVVGGRIKRAMDVTVASTILVLFLPLFLMTAAAIKLTSPGPVFYGHVRVGHGARRFRCWKFRTMCVDGDAVLERHLANDAAARLEWETTRKLQADPRVTGIGAVLREYSIDEFPQLLNVLLGDMSLVGPRPVVDRELESYGPAAVHYLAARPGITGLWQISGRSNLGYDRRVALDSRYVLNWSFWSDAAILLKTVPAVVLARGAY